MHFKRLIESKLFVWGLALLALLLTSVVLPSRTHADANAGARKAKTKQITQQKEKPDRGLILVR